MDILIEFFQEWGYWVVLFGAMIEGESVILTACFMAYLGYMSIYKIGVIAFFGTLFADQALYHVGHFYGKKLIKKLTKRFPSLKEPTDRAFKLLHDWGNGFILSCRFIYGIRIISPVVIGSAGISPQRFIPLNILAAFIWTVISCTGGYMLAGLIDAIGFDEVKHYIWLVSIVILAMFVSFVYRLWKKSHPSIPPKQ